MYIFIPIFSTKQVGRYRPPAVDKLFGELQRLREMLRAECQVAWIGLLQDFSHHYFKHKQAVLKVATIDVILSLAHVAQQEGYCKYVPCFWCACVCFFFKVLLVLRISNNVMSTDVVS